MIGWPGEKSGLEVWQVIRDEKPREKLTPQSEPLQVLLVHGEAECPVECRQENGIGGRACVSVRYQRPVRGNGTEPPAPRLAASKAKRRARSQFGCVDDHVKPFTLYVSDAVVAVEGVGECVSK